MQDNSNATSTFWKQADDSCRFWHHMPNRHHTIYIRLFCGYKASLLLRLHHYHSQHEAAHHTSLQRILHHSRVSPHTYTLARFRQSHIVYCRDAVSSGQTQFSLHHFANEGCVLRFHKSSEQQAQWNWLVMGQTPTWQAASLDAEFFQHTTVPGPKQAWTTVSHLCANFKI